MKRVTVLFLVILLIVLGIVVFTHMTDSSKSEKLLEENADAVQIATHELSARSIFVEQHEVDVVKKESSTVIIFTPPGRPEGQRGSNSGQPGFEVELDADMKPVKIHALR